MFLLKPKVGSGYFGDRRKDENNIAIRRLSKVL